MKKLHFEIDQKTYNKLLGLAYRIADNNYMLERFGRKESEIERAENHKSIMLFFEELDLAKVPFWLQNTVIQFAENWRRYKTENLAKYLESLTAYNIKVTASSI